MKSIPAEYADMGHVKPGDDIVFLGTPRRIVSIASPVHPDLGPYEVATDAYGWVIALWPHASRCLFPAKPEQLALLA